MSKIKCVIIDWKDNSDRDITIPSKFTVLNDNYEVDTIQALDEVLPTAAATVEAFIKRDTNGYPQEDSRLVIINSEYGPVNEQDSEFPNYRMWKRTYSVEPRTNDEIKVSIDDCCKIANAQVYPIERRVEYDDIYSVCVRRENLGNTLTQTEIDIMTAKENYALAMTQNFEIAKAKKQAVDAGIPFDLDSDWINTDPNENQ